MEDGDYEQIRADLAAHVHRHFGLSFKPQQWKSLENYLKRAATELRRSSDLTEISQWVSREKLSQAEFNALTKNLTVGETYFFREKAAFALLTDKVIAAVSRGLTSGQKRLRIWSAGCSTGEEPYSIAITLKETLSDANDWDISILATDLNPAALDKARLGVYRPWSFRDTPAHLKEKFFHQKGDWWAVSPEIKRMVTFRQVNLVTDDFYNAVPSPASFDLIFCRNVMMYFSADLIEKVAGRFWEALKDQGWFVTSQVELNEFYFSRFVRVQYHSGLFYQKMNVKPVSLSVSAKPASQAVKPRVVKHTSTSKANHKSESPVRPRLRPERVRSDAQKDISEKKTKPETPLNVSHAEDHVRGQFRLGNYEACIAAVRQLPAAQQQSPVITNLFVRSLANTGSYQEAESRLKAYLEQHSEDIGSIRLLADILSEQEKTEEADAQLVKVLYLNPDDIGALFVRHSLLRKLGKTAQSRKSLKRISDLIVGKADTEHVPGTDDMRVGTLRQMIAQELG
ncbi:MCP methyltransferase, CheR-type [Cyclonatronum proteinivorum]|uniref:MCP methyltransferase, CheR-type n=1 Tax=Cyclonatronum proteinivorum TaxID=1457365 RepID=A0A345UKZ8_9BACT|nr:CheR family methyltransferase [Cyclonatronum proteinivorum]AXJ01150.1 MCP methyltransferase, CheR-type [Cyclonatronum proteinivorum]